MKRIVGVVAALALVGCADRTVDEFIRASGVTFASCGQLQGRHGVCEGCEAAATCVNDALASCTPVQLEFTTPSIEGAPIVVDAFVHPVDGGCELVVFHDATQDCGGSGRCGPFGGGGDVTRTTGKRLIFNGSFFATDEEP